MYGTNSNKGTFFQSEQAKELSTEKCVLGNFSQRVRDSRSESGYSYENWSIRFVGIACGKALALNLKDKTFIELLSWSVHNPYNKQKEKNEPYILVTDFNIVADDKNGTGGDIGMVILDDADVPFN